MMGRSLLLAMGLLCCSGTAQADNSTQINFGCAPWDGQTLEIAVRMPSPPDGTDAPPAMLRATLWGKGLEAVRQGARSLVLPQDGADMNGNGRASVCVGKACEGREVSVQFDKAELHEGGAVAGAMKFNIPDNYQTFPFHGVLQGSQPCG